MMHVFDIYQLPPRFQPQHVTNFDALWMRQALNLLPLISPIPRRGEVSTSIKRDDEAKVVRRGSALIRV